MITSLVLLPLWISIWMILFWLEVIIADYDFRELFQRIIWFLLLFFWYSYHFLNDTDILELPVLCALICEAIVISSNYRKKSITKKMWVKEVDVPEKLSLSRMSLKNSPYLSVLSVMCNSFGFVICQVNTLIHINVNVDL